MKKCLEEAQAVEVVLATNGWPVDVREFDRASAVVMFCDGGEGHPVLVGDRRRVLASLMSKGVGIGAIHFALAVPKEKAGRHFAEWIGGFYEDLYSCNPIWSPDYRVFPAHPITRGIKPFSVRDEWYMHLRLRATADGVVPVLVARPSDAVRAGPYQEPKGPFPHVLAARGQEEIMLWALERRGGGRAFGFTGGHFHVNWGDENFRRVVLNAILWVARVEVPLEGTQSVVTDADLRANLDHKEQGGWFRRGVKALRRAVQGRP
jgi:type 1 glutamine amidotransferase